MLLKATTTLQLRDHMDLPHASLAHLANDDNKDHRTVHEDWPIVSLDFADKCREKALATSAIANGRALM